MNMVDDATGTTLSFLVEEKTTEVALRLLWAWIERYGIPQPVYCDRKNAFALDREPTVSEQLRGVTPRSHFERACDELGIEVIVARSPQAKGRVERNHAVYQDRLVKDLRLEEISDIESANERGHSNRVLTVQNGALTGGRIQLLWLKRDGSMGKPNILLIMTDQQHHRLGGFAGDKYVKTPTIDALAAEGTRFDLTYCANPVCVPSRYSMISGHSPHEFAGMEINYQTAVANRPPIASCVHQTPTLGWLLKSAGYDVFYGGKLHIEELHDYSPEARARFGFDCISSDTREELAAQSAEFLMNRRDLTPMFVWLSFVNPHDICLVLDKASGRPRASEADLASCPPLPTNLAPANDEPEWLNRFRTGTLGNESTHEIGSNRRFGSFSQSWSDDDWRMYRGAYRRYMSDVDRQIGIVLDGLRRSGLAENTVVIFTSDHGDHDGEHLLTLKRTFYEAAVHVPMIVCWDAHVRKNAVDDSHLVNNGLDLIPTVCDFAGVAHPEGLKGYSLKPLILEEDVDSWRPYVVSETLAGRMLRSCRYKYVVYHHQGSQEMLFDLQTDPTETRNLAQSELHTQVLKDHRAMLVEWVRDTHDAKGISYMKPLMDERP